VKHIIATTVLTVALTGGALTAHAEGDAAAGAKVFKSSCTRCHTIDEGGKNKVGPNLFGVFGATAGTRVASFAKRHSKAMKASGVVWDEKTLDGFLENPKKFMAKNRMTFPGVKKAADRENLIAYLKAAK
jgi:cytochrome c